jgi:phosphoglycerate dehydrogenase-like enzyme
MQAEHLQMTLKIVSLVPLPTADATRIRTEFPQAELLDAGGWFDGEYARTWPAATIRRYVAGQGQGTRAERDALLASADIVIAGFPFPLDLVARAPQLRWMHQTPAGASNLRQGDIWEAGVTVTTSRGHGETTAIAEYAMSGLLYFLKGFDRAALDKAGGAFNHREYRARCAEGKTLCVVGAGGIGREVARLGAGLGMRVVGTRRNTTRGPQDEVFETLASPVELHALLAVSDLIAICCQWTSQTSDLIGPAAFNAMQQDAILVNVARGEIIDEKALLDALNAGKVRGAALDVYVGEFESTPPSALWQHPQVLITPHTSGQTDQTRRRSTDVFCDNLKLFMSNEKLHYEVDWTLGY